MTGPYSHVLLIAGARSWADERTMRTAFNTTWRSWGGPTGVSRPLLVSGHCPKGADAMAERLWRGAGFDVLEMAADWDTHGHGAGFVRNSQMVEVVVSLREQGSRTMCAAFLDTCRKAGCPQARNQQLAPCIPGHFSHGTVHCRSEALSAGIETIDVFPSLLTSAG
ncbi:SLOG family protein [Streptomyces sp. NPDC056061]|uniref:SLOG family protein n=1 Tax=Streptomyces sp. NPDC056061 TaxID=3345700 RepID=UPI0035E387B2